jgi:hypothetical protein
MSDSILGKVRAPRLQVLAYKNKNPLDPERGSRAYVQGLLGPKSFGRRQWRQTAIRLKAIIELVKILSKSYPNPLHDTFTPPNQA